ncbi:MAG TPA: hypothetical protein VFM80_11860 [Gracilimonas sp.]|uniref:hypothetical protein n=1 Tax=Gracilimonas sp. TaxID=1974203 RepID=UPI002DA67F03|nr:hypothetical protein [Gracilimonas sp.]
MAIDDFFVDEDNEGLEDKRIFEIGDMKFIRIKDQEPLTFDSLKNFDGVIIEYTRYTFTLEMIKNIRSHNEEQVYLLPLFLYKSYGEYSDALSEMVDGTLERLNDLNSIAETTSIIKSRI